MSDPIFADFAADTVTVELYTGQDQYSQESWGAPQPYSCIVDHKNRLIRSPDGMESPSFAKVIFLTLTGITTRAKLSWVDPSGATVTPKILEVRTIKDPVGGNSHDEVYLA